MHRIISALAALSVLASCSLHSTATHWNGRVGPNGKPVYVKESTNIGLNLGIVLPVLGSTTTDWMLDELTGEIASESGDTVRVIQSASENYWYGFPPFTWVLTPVITTVSAEYEPSADTLAKDLAEQAAEKQ